MHKNVHFTYTVYTLKNHELAATSKGASTRIPPSYSTTLISVNSICKKIKTCTQYTSKNRRNTLTCLCNTGNICAERNTSVQHISRCMVEAGFGLVRNERACIQWNPVYKAFHRNRCCANETKFLVEIQT